MGQSNDKVEFQGIHNSSPKRRRIFNRQKRQQIVQYCQIPGCSCNLPHPQFNTKICSHCQQVPPPFLKTKYKPTYYEQQFVPEQPKQQLQFVSKEMEVCEAQSIPSKFNYYNAWSLPTQKYLIRQRSTFNSQQSKSVRNHSIYSGQQMNRQKIDFFVEDVTQKVAKAVDAPKIQFERRKQNMNLD